MKKYIADILTLLRAISAALLVVLIVQARSPEWALWVFVFGELTDAFDGIAARRWPFPEPPPRYRRYAEIYDMVIDVALGLAALAYVLIRINWISGLCLIGVTVILAASIEYCVYGRLFGAPERCRGNCLWRRNQPAAERLVLLRRKFYLVAIGVVIMIMLFACQYDIFFKICLIGIAVAIAITLIAIKQDRMNEVKTK